MIQAKTLFFTEPRKVEIRSVPLPPLAQGQMLVETICSAISPGTEMLVYRGQFPQGMSDVHDGLSSDLAYPLAYGYATVGRVIKISKDMRHRWKNRLVFAFRPHTSHFVATPEDVIPLPDGILPERACFFPNMETAVNLVQDGAPLLGERVLVLGQGIVGLLTASLLAEFPLEKLATADCYPLRRSALGALSFDPDALDFHKKAKVKGGYDLTFELSGSPSALNDALALTGFSGRIVIGSWYGEKKAALDLGGGFHRSRIRLISSQVSTIAPELRGRWDKERRFGVAWDALERIRPEKWITHRFTLDDAAQAYRLLDENPERAIQIILKYT
ncbi:MAG: zinc-binding alcohol dehydrogenase [Anaerolineales bacterium]